MKYCNLIGPLQVVKRESSAHISAYKLNVYTCDFYDVLISKWRRPLDAEQST